MPDEFQVKYDEFGPELIYAVHDAKVGMRGFLVLDNTALGLGKGGIRMTPSVSIGEVSKLARTTTWPSDHWRGALVVSALVGGEEGRANSGRTLVL